MICFEGRSWYYSGRKLGDNFSTNMNTQYSLHPRPDWYTNVPGTWYVSCNRVRTVTGFSHPCPTCVAAAVVEESKMPNTKRWWSLIVAALPSLSVQQQARVSISQKGLKIAMHSTYRVVLLEDRYSYNRYDYTPKFRS